MLLAAIEDALVEDRDLMPDTVPLTDQHGAGPEGAATPSRSRSLCGYQAAAGPSREPA
jgi:hypothetical protein